MHRPETVFLFDVDNTLLDNDSVTEDLRAFLEDEVGKDRSDHYWEIFEKLRNERGYADYLGALQRFQKIYQGRDAPLHRALIALGAAQVFFRFHLEPQAPHRHFAVPMVFQRLAPVNDCLQPLPRKHPAIARGEPGKIGGRPAQAKCLRPIAPPVIPVAV